MQGRKLSQLFFETIIFPRIQSLPLSILNRIQVAFLGEGSEISSFDDALSQDHNFVPRVIIFYDDDLEIEKVKALEQQILKDLPHEFIGFQVDLLGYTKAVEIHPRIHYIKEYLHIESWPLIASAWLTIEEQRLFELTAGVIYFDPVSKLGNDLKAIAFYPDEIRSVLLIQCWLRLSEGEAISRSIARKDVIAIGFYKTLICYYSIKLLHLVFRKYCPYKKWMGRNLQEIPGATSFHAAIEQLSSESDLERILPQIKQLYAALGELTLREFPKDQDPWWLESNLNLLNFNYEKIFSTVNKTIPSSLEGFLGISPPAMWGLVFDYSPADFKTLINSHAKHFSKKSQI